MWRCVWWGAPAAVAGMHMSCGGCSDECLLEETRNCLCFGARQTSAQDCFSSGPVLGWGGGRCVATVQQFLVNQGKFGAVFPW